MSRRPLIILAVLLVVAGAIGAGALLLLNTGGEISGEATAPTLAPSLSGAAITYDIVADQSQVRFELDEDLAGNRVTVVGTTDQVAGQIRVDLENPAASQVGVIRINARALQTDNSNRDGAIRRFVLQSAEDQYEFITFTPTSINGLPDSVAIGEPVNFSITGDLQVRDVVRPVTFEVTATLESEQQLVGTATTSIARAEFNLSIPNVPGVANVEETVLLAIDFVAVPAATS
jgi:polyisoprenoid-binding protein YceI